MVRNSGHMVPMDQPLWALDMIYQFVKEKPLPTPTSTVALTTLTTSAAEITLGSKLMTIMICCFFFDEVFQNAQWHLFLDNMIEEKPLPTTKKMNGID